MRRTIFSVVLLCAPALIAQDLANDFRNEGNKLGSDCKFSFGAIGGCAYDLFTDHPLHFAVGSLAPGNGFASGLALTHLWIPECQNPPQCSPWRNSWDASAVISSNGSWRVSGFLTLVRAKVPDIQVQRGRPTSPAVHQPDPTTEYPTFRLYSETTSLTTLGFYGTGPGTLQSNHAFFGLRETVTGGNAVYTINGRSFKKWRLALLGEANGRFVDARASTGQSSPSIEQIYSQSTAPGLASFNAFAQVGEGVRIRPELANGHIQLNYQVSIQEFASPGNHYNFTRLTTDLSHSFPLYQNARNLQPKDFNAPDQCGQGSDAADCPPVLPPRGATRNLEGSFNLRVLLTESFAPSGDTIPFYFQPTLGGSDINGNSFLASYPDYRFRAPDLLLFRASFEHSISKWPIGVLLMLDEGKVGLTSGDLGFSHFLHSYSAGLTLRAGGFPMVSLLFSWGGREGTHTIFNMNTALLGGSAHPSLF